jgi:ribosomal protein S18 acetylase RimI-like enzyme
VSEPTPGPSVRRARPEDLAAAGDVTVAAYAQFTLGPADPYVEKLRDAATRHREAELWVAELDGAVVGTVTIALEGSPWREIAERGEGEFRMLAVAPTAQRRGVGEALMRLVMSRFRDLGAHAVVLSSLAEMTAAHRVYERQGFRRLPERDWSPFPGVDLLAFRAEL